jgi:ADP-ribosyl-[dinitrogen reductase] hydrolase
MFYKWYNSGPFDIGISTEIAFGKGNRYEDMKINSKKNIKSLSNGCLMKISPLGSLNYLSNKKFDLKIVSSEICELTNPNEICKDICNCYIQAINIAIKTNDPIKTYNCAYTNAKLPITKMILNDAKTKYKPVKLLNEKNVIEEIDPDGSFQGYIGISFQSAFYHLLNTDDYVNMMIHIIGMGGDTDTNCCISGALYGACYGVKKIPIEWIKNILDFTNDKDRVKKYIPLNHKEIYFQLTNLINFAN